MSRSVRLPLDNPIAMAGSKRGIWIVDQATNSLTCFDANDASTLSRIPLDEMPVDLAATSEFVASGLASGDIVAFNLETDKELWRRSSGSGELELRASASHLWVAQRSAAVIYSYDRSGYARRFEAPDLQAFAPLADGLFWLSSQGILITTTGGPTAHLPENAMPAGAMVVCANALWLSITKGLLLFDLRSLDLRAAIEAPEGPVPHLICDADGRLLGGQRGVFIFDPAADAMVKPLPIHLTSTLRDLAISGIKVWALEAAEPVVHILDVP